MAGFVRHPRLEMAQAIGFPPALLPSFPRKRESRIVLPKTGILPPGPFYRHSRASGNPESHCQRPTYSRPAPSTVIPAQAGIQSRIAKDRHTTNRAFLDSRLCGNDGRRGRNDGRRGGRYGGCYTANLTPFGRALPPCTDGSAHHFSASRLTPTYTASSKPSRSQITRRSSKARLGSRSAK